MRAHTSRTQSRASDHPQIATHRSLPVENWRGPYSYRRPGSNGLKEMKSSLKLLRPSAPRVMPCRDVLRAISRMISDDAMVTMAR